MDGHKCDLGWEEIGERVGESGGGQRKGSQEKEVRVRQRVG